MVLNQIESESLWNKKSTTFTHVNRMEELYYGFQIYWIRNAGNINQAQFASENFSDGIFFFRIWFASKFAFLRRVGWGGSFFKEIWNSIKRLFLGWREILVARSFSKILIEKHQRTIKITFSFILNCFRAEVKVT